MDYRDIGHIFRGAFDPGKLKIQKEGLYFKSTKSGKVFQVRESDIDVVEWMRVARGYELKVLMLDGSVTKFGGFKENDFMDLKNFIKTNFQKDLREIDLCVKGWNWGEVNLRGSLLSFNVDKKPSFEVPLKEVSKVTSGKNEVVMEFHMSDDTALSLVEMRFHVPQSNVFPAQDETGENADQESAGPDPVKELHDKILARADVIQATGDAIVTFSEIHCLTPRGRYAIKVYPSFLQLHGKTYDYKIPHKSVMRLFLLPHNDQRQMLFVIQLDPPLRQGQTRYYFVMLSLPTEQGCDVSLSLSDQEIEERYGESTKLSQKMSGSFYEIFSRVMKVFVGKKVTIPGSFKSKSNRSAITCSCRATSGYLYPLDKGFIFVHKPAIYIKFDGIASVNFARMSGSAGVSRSFDFEVELKDGNAHHFSSLMKEDYDRLSQFVSDKKLRVKNKVKMAGHVSYKDDGSSGSDHDAYLERMKAEGEDRDSEDEDSDFVAAKSGSDDELEFDSDAKITSDENEGSDAGGEERQHSPKKRKASSTVAKPPAKRKKAVPKESGGSTRKAKKDPNAPKKPMSTYMLWLQDVRSSIKADNPGISVIDVSKKAGAMWKTISDIEKRKYTELCQKAKKRYQEQMAEYRSTGATSQSKSLPPKAVKKTSSKASSSSSTGSLKVKSTEFVPSDEDDSSSDAKESLDEDDSAQDNVRTRRSNAGDANLVSMPSDDEQLESDADLTSGSNESESESD